MLGIEVTVQSLVEFTLWLLDSDECLSLPDCDVTYQRKRRRAVRGDKWKITDIYACNLRFTDAFEGIHIE